MCLLLIRDERTRADLLRPLREAGYRVGSAATGAEARALAAVDKYRLLITELDLNDGDGESLMYELRQWYGMDGIAVGGFVTNERLATAQRSGLRRFFMMPLRPEELIEAVDDMTGATA
jgi:DNA-binding NtrC family response regulator